MQLFEDGRIVISYVNVEDNQKIGAKLGDEEGLVEMLRDIEGVDVSVLLKEKEGANGYKISLRSHENVNVSDIALLLGGGGHAGAAGCFIAGTLEQAKTKIINTIRHEL